MENSYFQQQMDESNFLEEIRNLEHPPWHGTSNTRRKSKGFSWRIRRVSSTPQDSLPDAGEAFNDFWSMLGNFIFRHHVEPRVKLYSPREEPFPIPLKYIDVSRTARTNLDVMQERRIMTKTEIARSARGPKLQGPRAEDALAESYLVQKFLVTW